MEEGLGHMIEVGGSELAEHLELFSLDRLEDKLLVMRGEEALRRFTTR